MSIRDDLKAFMDGELTSSRAEQVRQAIANDPALQQEIRDMKLLGNEIAARARVPEIKGVEATLQAVRGSGKPAWQNISAWPYYALGGIGFVIIVGIFLPVFAQNKEAARKGTQYLADYRSTSAAPMSMKAKAEGGEENIATRSVTTPATTTGGDSSSAFSGRERALAQDKQPGDASVISDTHAPRVDRSRLLDNARILAPRRVIQTADLGVTVPDPSRAETKTIDLAKASGGYQFSSSLDKDDNDQPVAKVQIRVPVEKFETVVKQIKALGKVTSDHVTGEDVTVKVADTDARVHVMQAQEEGYVGMLRNARRVDDALEIRGRLDDVRETIESLKAQSSTLKDQAAMSTINATFSSKAKEVHPALVTQPQDWARDSWTSAVNGFTELCRVIAQGAIFLFVYSPLWLPVVTFGWWQSRKLRRSSA